jgi:hypothetical protein
MSRATLSAFAIGSSRQNSRSLIISGTHSTTYIAAIHTKGPHPSNRTAGQPNVSPPDHWLFLGLRILVLSYCVGLSLTHAERFEWMQAVLADRVKETYVNAPSVRF